MARLSGTDSLWGVQHPAHARASGMRSGWPVPAVSDGAPQPRPLQSAVPSLWDYTTGAQAAGHGQPSGSEPLRCAALRCGQCRSPVHCWGCTRWASVHPQCTPSAPPVHPRGTNVLRLHQAVPPPAPPVPAVVMNYLLGGKKGGAKDDEWLAHFDAVSGWGPRPMHEKSGRLAGLRRAGGARLGAARGWPTSTRQAIRDEIKRCLRSPLLLLLLPPLPPLLRAVPLLQDLIRGNVSPEPLNPRSSSAAQSPAFSRSGQRCTRCTQPLVSGGLQRSRCRRPARSTWHLFRAASAPCRRPRSSR